MTAQNKQTQNNLKQAKVKICIANIVLGLLLQVRFYILVKKWHCSNNKKHNDKI